MVRSSSAFFFFLAIFGDCGVYVHGYTGRALLTQHSGRLFLVLPRAPESSTWTWKVLASDSQDLGLARALTVRVVSASPGSSTRLPTTARVPSFLYDRAFSKKSEDGGSTSVTTVFPENLQPPCFMQRTQSSHTWRHWLWNTSLRPTPGRGARRGYGFCSRTTQQMAQFWQGGSADGRIRWQHIQEEKDFPKLRAEATNSRLAFLNNIFSSKCFLLPDQHEKQIQVMASTSIWPKIHKLCAAHQGHVYHVSTSGLIFNVHKSSSMNWVKLFKWNVCTLWIFLMREET